MDKSEVPIVCRFFLKYINKKKSDNQDPQLILTDVLDLLSIFADKEG